MRSARTIICIDCNKPFETVANNQKRCNDCIPIHKKKYNRKYLEENRLTGIGSGNSQGRGKDHHSYKSGIGIFRKIKLDSLSEYVCENCNKDLSNFINDKIKGRYFWCVHHIDGNRNNNDLSNLKLLCKRCHQLEHNCTDNLPN